MKRHRCIVCNKTLYEKDTFKYIKDSYICNKCYNEHKLDLDLLKENLEQVLNFEYLNTFSLIDKKKRASRIKCKVCNRLIARKKLKKIAPNAYIHKDLKECILNKDDEEAIKRAKEKIAKIEAEGIKATYTKMLLDKYNISPLILRNHTKKK